jgi:hypothetical protein
MKSRRSLAKKPVYALNTVEYSIINRILLSANTNLRFWSHRPHLGNELHTSTHAKLSSYPVTCVCQPSNLSGFYGQSLLFNVDVVTPMPAAPLGSPPCTGTRSCLRVVMHPGTSRIFYEQFLRRLELLLPVAQYLAFMEWLVGPQGR